jgi:hypothetical protein
MQAHLLPDRPAVRPQAPHRALKFQICGATPPTTYIASSPS